MIKSAIIDIKDNVSFKEKILFLLNIYDIDKFMDSFKISKKEIYIFYLPVNLKESRINNIILNHFIKALKKKSISKIILSDKLKDVIYIKSKLNNEFNGFTGEKVINSYFYNIIKKYISYYNKENCEIVFISNNFSLFYNLFVKIFNKYRVSYVITENIIEFSEFKEYIYNEYGIHLNVTEPDKFVNEEKFVTINIDNKILYPEESINLEKTEIIYSRCNELSFIYKFFNYINANIVEFFVYNMYGALENNYIDEFFSMFKLRIVKINKKWLTIHVFFYIIRYCMKFAKECFYFIWKEER